MRTNEVKFEFSAKAHPSLRENELMAKFELSRVDVIER